MSETCSSGQDIATPRFANGQSRACTRGYDKKKVYNLQIDDEKVLAAVKRAADKHPSPEEIPKRPQTAVHLIIQLLVAKQIISVRTGSKAIATAGKKKSKRAKK